jgi:hypothetical protein
MALKCIPTCDLTKIVFSVDQNSNPSQPQGDIFDSRNIHIAVKVPRSGGKTFYKTNQNIPDHRVIFSICSEDITIKDPSWTKGLPSGYSQSDCEDDETPPNSYSLILKD